MVTYQRGPNQSKFYSFKAFFAGSDECDNFFDFCGKRERNEFWKELEWVQCFWLDQHSVIWISYLLYLILILKSAENSIFVCFQTNCANWTNRNECVWRMSTNRTGLDGSTDNVWEYIDTSITLKYSVGSISINYYFYLLFIFLPNPNATVPRPTYRNAFANELGPRSAPKKSSSSEDPLSVESCIWNKWDSKRNKHTSMFNSMKTNAQNGRTKSDIKMQ